MPLVPDERYRPIERLLPPECAQERVTTWARACTTQRRNDLFDSTIDDLVGDGIHADAGEVMRVFVTALLLAAACGSKDNSADTDQASQDLRKASSTVSEKRDDVAAGGDDVERRKREITKEQQDLAAKEAALETNRRQLGSAQGTLTGARTAYAAAVNERFTKLEAALAGLATQVDAASKDAAAGLTARRDLLATRLSAMPADGDSSWAAYTKDVDTTFDAIERDLRAARH